MKPTPEPDGRDPDPSSILFQTPDKAVVLLDVPRSLEESQVLSGQQPVSRIYSDSSPAVPLPTPEPKQGLNDSAASAQSQGTAVADLMTGAAVRNALQQLADHYSGPYHLPRLVSGPGSHVPAAGAESPSCPVVVPPGARYLRGSIEDMRQTFLDTAPKFDLIVLDPPWPNRSARRRRRKGCYATADTMREMSELLAAIPVAARISPDGLVAIWITNKPGVRQLLTSAAGVFAAWGLELVTEWTWLKIAASGEPLYDVDSLWRKPWETLLIAKPRRSRPPRALGPKVVVAVPDVHSRKPNLRPLFCEVLGNGYVGLEVFARNLTAGWWSWGDEVLKFQEVQYWQPATGQPMES
ncbi:MT-A70 domain-containing protein [Hirsutella rhossiliensis]|uniref:MT-A70 domain-containing protein n=1 Tax=Hirsutella rhossiliensis TaxID=111463 RepID=A0A9P8SL67_9HYPO|nr:MT-A70 domain-containing protein [Hirsutella rhossiliensis]KAH0966646.1 MT-A70 domain-containing protein [Hirsutella rhossiliensis]